MEHINKDLLDRFWQEQQELMVRLGELGVGQYFNMVEDLAKAFKLQDRCLRCMDEGTAGGVHMAGSGILNKEAAVELVQ